MSLRDIITELRSGTPDPVKAARWLRYAGYACFLAAAWNAAFTFFDSEGLSKLPLPPYFNEGLVVLVVAGCLFILSSRGVAEKNTAAVLWGQLAIILVVALLASFSYWMMWMPDKTGFGDDQVPGGWFGYFWSAACVLVSLQFFVPAFFAFGYLQRLKPVIDHNTAIGVMTPPAPAPGIASDQDNYCHALLPFGVHTTFFVVLATGMVLIILVGHFVEGIGMHGVFLPMFLVIFFGPILYNYIPSPFQKQRRAVNVATGGGSIFLLNGSWPFFRLLIYPDGIEIRFFLHAWFIPYTRLESVTLNRSFLTKALLIRSDLPKVPSRIRFYSLRKKDLLAQIEACQKRDGQ
jgi:hypothetical protein